jgi:hypothetical protein
MEEENPTQPNSTSSTNSPISWWKTPRLTIDEVRYIKSLQKIFKVKDAAKRWIPYNLMPHQMDFHKDDIALKGSAAKSRVVVKSRNTSFTTSVCISNLMAVPYYPNQIVPFVRLNEKRAYDLIDEIKDLIRNMEPLNIGGLAYPFEPTDVNMDSAGKIRFPNKVSFEAYPANAIAAENIRGLRISGSAGVMDECFTNHTKIWTNLGLKRFSYIKNHSNIKILSYNLKNNKFEYKSINGLLKKDKKERDIYKIGFYNNSYSIHVTEDHPFYDENFNIILAKNIKIGTNLITNRKKSTYCLSNIQKEILYGILLGDGYIQIYKNNLQSGCLSITHGESQKEYLHHIMNIFDIKKHYVQNKDDEYGKRTLYKAMTRFSPEYYDIKKLLYSNKKKKISLEFLNRLTDVSLAYWFMDDGSKTKKSYRLHTENFSYDDQLIIQKWFLNKYNIKPSIYKNKKYFYLHFTVKDSKILNSIISQYIIPSLRYKLINDVSSNKYKKIYISKNNYKTTKVKGIKKDKELCEVYNLDIKDNHNFFVSEMAVLVHNCNFMDSFKDIYTSERDAASGFTMDGEKHFQQNLGTTLKNTTTPFALWFKNQEELQQKYPESSDFTIYKWQVFDPAVFNKDIEPLKQPKLIPIVPWHVMHDLNRKYLEDLNTFLEEYMAFAVDGEDQFYPSELYTKCVDKTLKSINTPDHHGEYFAGIDVASVNDFFVLSIFENVPEEREKITYIRQENGDITKKVVKELTDVFYQKYLYYDRAKDISEMEAKSTEIINNWAQFGLKKVRIDSAGIGLQLYQNLKQKFKKQYPNLIEYVPLGTIKVGHESKRAKEVVHVNQKQLMIYDRMKVIDNEMQKMHYSVWTYEYECERTKEYGHGDIAVANAYAVLPLNFQGKRQYGEVLMAQETNTDNKTTKEAITDFHKLGFKEKMKFYRRQ